MKFELGRHEGDAEDYTLCLNRAAAKDAPWTDAQDAILSDRGFAEARETITRWQGYATTPLYMLHGQAAELGIDALYYKDEAPRFGLGSFKALGGAYAVARLLRREISEGLGREISMEEVIAGIHPKAARGVTICCATDGNHGRSVAWGAERFGARCVIYIHATVSEGRKAAIEAYGAEVRRITGNYDDSVREAQETAAREGWFIVSDTSYPGYMEVPKDVMQGYELMAAEAFDALPEPPTHIFLQTGVGGMAASVAALAKRRWGRDRPVVVLADPDLAACWVETYRAGAPRVVAGDLDTMMAGLACGEISALAWEILETHADAAMAVPDGSAIRDMRALAYPAGDDPALIAGESAVAGLSALRAARADPDAAIALSLARDARVLIFGTEGDTDPELYARIMAEEAA
ncbi:MAG: diaminopropionate ammonia-lyase [Pseudomonadota bacterium]